jgi:transcriptional regulator with XRE-family HTH domain
MADTQRGTETAPRRRRMHPLQTIRQERGLSQQQAADHLGMSQPAYSRYETGASIPPPDRRARLVRLLHTTETEIWTPTELARPSVAIRHRRAAKLQRTA